jgi:DNA-directed RNA polymerase subunit RPC12/RpoP
MKYFIDCVCGKTVTVTQVGAVTCPYCSRKLVVEWPEGLYKQLNLGFQNDKMGPAFP